MKKAGLLIAAILVAFFWANSHRNELAVWFNSDSFYKPVFTGELDVFQSGSSVTAELTSSYNVKHGFFLIFPCDSLPVDFFANLDGSIRYTIKSGGMVLESRKIAPPSHPIGGINEKGCSVALFTFDLPYQGHDSVTLEVVVLSPITRLASYQNIRCEVAPAYWPK